MAKSQETFNKKEKEKKRVKKRKEKIMRKEERKENSEGGKLENMIAYVDEYGNISDTPPDPEKKSVIDASEIDISGVGRNVEEEEAPRKGRIDYFNTEKGYGFIKELDTKEKYFVHINGLIDEVKERDMVSFEVERGLKGLNAVNVKKLL